MNLTTPISHYYKWNKEILYLFNESYELGYFAIAFRAGKQYVETALFEIPRHGYYGCPRHNEEKRDSDWECLRVSDMLKLMLENDEGEGDESEIEGFIQLAKGMSDKKILSEYSEERENLIREISIQKRVKGDKNGDTFKKKSLDCCISDSLCGDIFINDLYNKFTFHSDVEKSPSQSALVSLDCDDVCQINQIKKSKILSELNGDMDGKAPKNISKELPLRATYSLEKSVSFRNFESRNRFLIDEEENCLSREEKTNSSGRIIHPPSFCSYPSIATCTTPEVASKNKDDIILPICTLAQCYVEDFQHLQNVGKVSVYYLDTYQGKNPASVNGCTVIAPLLAIHHFHNTNDGADILADSTIENIIDIETPKILPRVRENLGLCSSALIIPSDVHDFFMEENFLSQEQFFGCCGGDILSQNHLGEFMALLSKGKGIKLAATLFFHEHVVCILKNNRPDGEVWYDMIDSLPCQKGAYGSLQLHVCDESQPSAVRIRCKTVDSLETTLRWYSCMKFTEENKKFIDSYSWDERNSDFDPRVFQAFVWSEL